MKERAAYPQLAYMEGVRKTTPSRREAEVLGLYACGLSKTKIADELSIDESSVKTYLERLHTKKDHYLDGSKGTVNLIIDGLNENIIDKDAVLASCKPNAFDSLTLDETELVNYLKRGLTDAEIMGVVFYSESTIKHNLSSLYEKLGTTGRYHTAAAAHAVFLKKLEEGEILIG